MEELINKINELFSSFNDSFKLEANIINDNNEEVAVGLKIKELKNDGGQFISLLLDMFSQIINSNSDYELVYDESKGLALAKKIVTVEYIYDDKE